MLDQFLAHLRALHRSPNTIRIRSVYLRQLQGMCDLNDATPEQLRSVLAAHPEWKPETINAAISSWRAYYKWAVRFGHVPTDPTADLELAHVPRIVKIVADDDAIKTGLAHASLRDRAILRLGRECALRRFEIATLRTTDRDGHWLNITGKGGRVRRIHLEPDLYNDLLLLEAASSGYYFPGRQDGHLGAHAVYQIVRRLTGYPTHSLRRRALTVVYERSGHDIRLAQELAGHSSPTITAIYIAVSDDTLQQASRYASLVA